MQKDVCKVKCHGIIGCVDNLTISTLMSGLTWWLRFDSRLSDLHAEFWQLRQERSLALLQITQLPGISGAQGVSMERRRADFYIFAYAVT